MGWNHSGQAQESSCLFPGLPEFVCSMVAWLHDVCLSQLLQQIHKVNFLLHKHTVAFDDIGDPLDDYDIIAWDWNGPEWTFEVIGSATLSPVQLDINKTKIRWHGKNNQVTGTWSVTR